MSDDDPAAEMSANAFSPLIVGDRGVVTRNEVREDEGLDTGQRGNPADVFGTRMAREKMLTQPAGVRDSVQQRTESRQIQYLVDEYIGAPCEFDQLRRVGGVAGEHYR